MTLTLERPGLRLPGAHPRIESITRREFVIGGTSLAALLAASCGRDEPTSSTPASTTRAYAGPYGNVELPQSPQRVVTMYPTDSDIALVLGLPIVAAPGATGTASQPFAAYQAAELVGVKRITASFEPDYEAIAAARPDVIIDSALSPGDKAGYDTLSQIAPVLAYEPKDWRDYLDVAAKAFGREQLAGASLAQFDDRAADVRATLGPWQGKTFASIFAFPAEVIIAGADAQVHQVLQGDLGLQLHHLVAPESDDRITLSAENLEQLDADVLIVPVYPKEDSLDRDRGDYDQLRAHPLWGQLPAVRAGNIFEFSGELVYTSPRTAAALLEELADQLGT